MYTSLELLGLADALEKRARDATFSDSVAKITAAHPYLIPGLLGAGVGGGIGALFKNPDEYGQSRRAKNALIGALAGGALGMGAGGVFKNEILNSGISSALANRDFDALARIIVNNQ